MIRLDLPWRIRVSSLLHDITIDVVAVANTHRIEGSTRRMMSRNWLSLVALPLLYRLPNGVQKYARSGKSTYAKESNNGILSCAPRMELFLGTPSLKTVG